MQYIFDYWPGLKAKLRAAGRVLLCLDFDGTLTPIKPTPHEPKLERDIELLLRRISRLEVFVVGIVSGRTLKDIKNRVGIKSLFFAGNHGLEIFYKNKKFIYPAAKKYVSVFKRIARSLKKQLKSFPGAILEDKGFSLSLHYRLVKKEEVRELKKIFLKIIEPYLSRQKIKLTYGKKVWELKPPVEWDKGKAVVKLAEKFKTKDLFTLYIGDDVTDEDAFRAVNRIKGMSIRVGRKRASAAQYYLKSARETKRLLEKIGEIR